MDNIAGITSIVTLIADGGLIVFLIFSVFAFFRGWIIPKPVHDKLQKSQEEVVDHMIEKINGSFNASFEKQEQVMFPFVERIDCLVEDYKVFTYDLKAQNGKVLKTLRSIERELKKQNGD